MNRIIAVVGNSGIGKTTLVRQLCEAAGFAPALEQHAERPFQRLFAKDLPRYALANQVDYLLYRAEQEKALRQSAVIGIVDGGLDLDFFGFSQLFLHKGYLTVDEYPVCERLYRLLRELLPPPDIYIYLTAPVAVVEQRFANRGRELEIAARQDLAELDKLIGNWMRNIEPAYVITMDVAGQADLNEAASAAGHCMFRPEQISSILRTLYMRLGRQ